MKNEWNKWKNHFFEMKGDVGMSSHEKEREQEDAFTQTHAYRASAHALILSYPSLHLCFFQDNNEFHVANSM